MPKRLGMRRKPRRKTRRTTRRKPRSSYNRVARTVGFPATYYTKLRYCDNFFPSIAASGTYNVNYVNGLFNPRTLPSTGGIHQPMYFDQMALIYTRYRVFGFKYVIKMCNLSSDKSLTINMQTGNAGAMDTSTTTASERVYDRDSLLGPQKSGVYKGYVDVAKVYGVPKATVRNENDWGPTVYQNTPMAAYLKIMVQNPWITACNLQMSCEITYFCKFYDRNNVAASVV